MRLTPEQLRESDEEGRVILPGCFSGGEVAALRAVADDALLRYGRSYRLAAE